MEHKMTQTDMALPLLTGAHNFRDLGGYAAADGHHVARGKVFRSGTLAALTDADQDVLASLGIKFVCDFRSTHERRNRPSKFAESQAFEVWASDHESSAGDLVRALASPAADAALSRQLMIEAYRTLPYEQAASYAVMFRRIAAGDVPLVFHCSAGKDRTGIAAALLLEVLGVARETVVADYVLTDRTMEKLAAIIGTDPSWGRLGTVDQAVWEPMLRADPDYIITLFEMLDEKHGGAAGFMREAAGLDNATLDEVRAKLLEPAQ